MSGFDFLHSSRGLRLRQLNVSLPRRLQAPAFALACALLIVCSAWAIERARLQHAQHVEAVYRNRFERSERGVKRTHLYYNHVARLVALDRRVRAIVASGDADALRLAEIADALPERVSLTSIARAGSVIDLEGEAQDFRIVGAAIRALARVSRARNPGLRSITETSADARERRVKYAIRLEAVP